MRLGYARLIWGAALPEAARTREVERTLRRGVEFLLSYRMERGNYPSDTRPSHLWHQLSFPLFYQADVLFVLRAVDAAGAIETSGLSLRSPGSWHARTLAGGGPAGHHTPIACHRGSTRASGSRCRSSAS
ncbi:MAG: hypothetical protein M3O91_05345 [Chloroflexota bacterium]|nr:hypothetical protein [Chloroflexota bacterium]